MRVLLTSAGLETEEIKEYFVKMLGKDVSMVKALFIPTAAIDAGAIEVLPKCMNDVSLTIFSAIDNTKFVKFITEIQDKNIMISLYKASFGY